LSKPVQDLKVERKSIKKTQTEANLEMKNLGTQPQTNLTNSLTEYKRGKRESQAQKTQ
jgi:cytochrome c553